MDFLYKYCYKACFLPGESTPICLTGHSKRGDRAFSEQKARFLDFRLTIITLPAFFEEEAECIGRLFEAGLESLHLRKPGCSETEIRDLIETIAPQYRCRMIINGHHNLAKEYGLKGIHLNSTCETVPEGYDDMIVGRSCHSVSEAAHYGRICDYVFLSPVFDSISKKGYRTAFSLSELAASFKDGTLGHNVIALGGIDDSNIIPVAEAGFAGAALLGYIWENPLERFNTIRQKISSK